MTLPPEDFVGAASREEASTPGGAAGQVLVGGGEGVEGGPGAAAEVGQAEDLELDRSERAGRIVRVAVDPLVRQAPGGAADDPGLGGADARIRGDERRLKVRRAEPV